RLPSAWVAPPEAVRRTYRASRLAYDGRAWESGFPGDDGHTFAPITLPGRSWAVEPIANLVPFEAQLLRHAIEDVVSDTGHDGLMSVTADHRPRVGSIETSKF